MKKEINIFKIIGFGGALISIISFIIICYNISSSYVLDLNYTSFNKFLQIYNFPIKVAMGTITLFGAISILENSKKSQAQMLITLNQKNFSNYIEHLRIFNERLNFLPLKRLEVKNPNMLYLKVFPKNNFIDFDIKGNSLYIENIIQKIHANLLTEISCIYNYPERLQEVPPVFILTEHNTPSEKIRKITKNLNLSTKEYLEQIGIGIKIKNSESENSSVFNEIIDDVVEICHFINDFSNTDKISFIQICESTRIYSQIAGIAEGDF